MWTIASSICNKLQRTYHTIRLTYSCYHSCTHKSRNKSLVNNYCPISLLCNTSKILEQLIYNKIIHLISSFLTLQQFGFLKNRSTIQQLLVLFDVIMSSGHQSDVIYFDFKKAFDSVPHNELVKSMGISGNLWLWFKSYLSNCQQCMKVNNKYSHLLPVLSRIPQGNPWPTPVSYLH